MDLKMFRTSVARVGAAAVCMATLTVAPTLAQQGGGRMQMTPEARVAAIDKAVTLTDDQKTKITAIFTEDAQKMADLRASGDPDMRSKMMAMRTDENTKIKALLTDDQKPKFDAYLASMPQGRPGGGAPPPPPQQ